MDRRSLVLFCLAMVLGITSGASAALIAHWPLDGDAKDIADGHHGTLVGGATFVQDPDRGTVLSVDGVDGHVAVPHSKDFEFSASNSYTIMAWAYINAVTGTWQGMIAESRDQGDHYGIWVTDAGNWMGGGWNNQGSKVPTKIWVHVAYVQNGANGTATTYVNGVADWTGGTRNGTGLGDFWIGGAQLPVGEGPPHEVFGGLIDDVRVYNHALTAAEVKAFIPPKLKAYNPQPTDGATGVTIGLLQWTKGDTARFHNVYLGTSPELTQANRVTPPMWTQPMYYYPGVLESGVTYYWRVDEVEADNKTIHTGKVWSFTTMPLTAYAPSPADGSMGTAQAPALSWTPGQNAVESHVYFGDSQAAVKESAPETDRGVIDGTSFYAGLLRAGTTYYWRVDGLDAYKATKAGKVWSFTTGDPVEGKVLREWWTMIDGTNVSDLTADPRYPSSPTGSELMTSLEGPTNWADNYGSRLSGWLVPATSGEYIFWIASDDGGELWLSTGIDPNSAVMIASVSGWTDSRQWEDMPSQKSAPVTLEAGQKYYIQALQKEGVGGDNVAVAWQTPDGARDVIAGQFLQTYALPPLKAAAPSPANGAVDVIQSPTLSWFAGEKATQHQVYLGPDADAVANADASTTSVYKGQQAGTTFEAGDLEWGKTYYWRVDEINTGEPESPWKGSLWSFATANFIAIDDFESYTNDSPNRVFQTWIDGFGFSPDGFFPQGDSGNGSGAMIGYDPTMGNIMEGRVVHGGKQAMPMDYNNVNSPYYSEAERTWTAAQNWTRNGVDTLALYVRGQGGNGADVLYVTLDDSTGKSATVNYGDNTAVKSGAWVQWNIPLSGFGGVNAAKIKKITIGVGNRAQPTPGGAGLIFIDDLRATKSTP
jgi:hypothetical protein